MKSRYNSFHLKCITTLVLVLFCLTPSNIYATEEEEEEEKKVITFPHKICNESEMGFMPNGYHYELWTNKEGGNVCMNVSGNDATFSANWSNVGNFVARVGLMFDTTKTHQEIGKMTADFAFSKSGLQNMSYYGVYGWTVKPLVEYYVLEDWNSWNPSKDASAQKKGTVNIDGGTYDVWYSMRYNMPSIEGEKTTFPQIFSIRTQTRQSGHIDISKHMESWEKMGIGLGKMYEAKIKVEGYKSSGNCNVTKAEIKVNGQIPTVTLPRMVKDRYTISGNSTVQGVYNLITLTGETIRSVEYNPARPDFFPTNNIARGMYYLQLRGNGVALVTKPIIVR